MREESGADNGEGIAPDGPGSLDGNRTAFIHRELEKSRRDVLDLTLRNPLLNFSPSGRRGIEVVDELSRELLRILVRGGRVMYFLPAAEDATEALGQAPADQDFADVPAELVYMLGVPADDPDEVATWHTDNKLQTAVTLASLNLRLRESFRQARLSIEEQGVNILYLALGMLRWYESEHSTTERRAPLILIPVRLNRSSVRENFKLAWNGDEIEANLSLEAKLKQDFGVRLPQMPGEEDLDVDEYMHRVREAVSGQERWSVHDNEVHLNFFSFSKLLIYKDLDPQNWPEENQPGDHPLVRQLYGGDGFAPDPPVIGAEEHIDDRLREEGLHQVVDADSSQTLAVVDAVNGRNLVIQGPPGTGKSQTITNLLAEALARDKKVLFVAEKMAALEVVKRRLDAVHLGDACLELHSHKTNKRVVLDELQRTLALGRPQTGEAAEDRVLLEDRRERLNDYARAVNSPVGSSGLSPHVLVGRLAKLETGGLAVDGPGLGIRESASWSGQDFARRLDLVREMQSLVPSIGIPVEHAYWGCGRLHFVPADEHRIREVLEAALSALHELGEGVGTLQRRLGLEADFGGVAPDDASTAIRTVRRVAEAPVLNGADHRSSQWVTQAAQLAEVAEAARSYADARAGHDSLLIPEAWRMDMLETRQVLRACGDKWWRLFSGSFRRARARLRGMCRTEPPKGAKEQVALVDAILEAQRSRRRTEESGDLVQRLFPGLLLGERIGAHRDFAQAVGWLVGLHDDKTKGQVRAEVHDLLDQDVDRAELGREADACQHRVEALDTALEVVSEVLNLRPDRFEPGTALNERLYVHLEAWLDRALARVPSAHDIVRFNQLERHAAERGIPEAAVAAASHKDAGRHLAELFEHACYSAWMDAALRERPVLAEFDGATHEGIVQRFRELDMGQFHHNRALIAGRHWERLPRHQGGGQLRVLRREFQKKSRHLPVRRLMSEAGRAIQSIKPVFMMSPLSIAKYIPPGSVDFDMVIFDEASQVRPVEALGAIIRGKQAIVVGDSKQLPPTSFFDRMGDAEEEQSETADLESILGMFCAQGAPERMLRWHYRSRHESLIAVSNYEFYDNRLMVFPSPDGGKVETGLVFNHNPQAKYQRRGVNADEAKAVAQAVMEHARTTPDLTLGVAAFNLAQARRIEDEVDILRRGDTSHEEFFAEHPEEPFFVKNLENVQGDERDVILISIGYGKINGTYLPMNFGPLNKEGGERRLNVLITRARRRCVVHCNFVPADLDLRRSKARGVGALKTFLEYAKTGVLDIPGPTGREADSPFEEAVATELRARGHDVAHQIGSIGFFIDLAVVDPEQPGRYLLGIECDGASYHSARSARDRDRLRQQVLEGLGWKIHRIWSTDWFRNPRRELDKVEEAIGLAVAGARVSAPVSRTRQPAQPLERVDEPAAPAPDPARPYTVADLYIGPRPEPLHEVSPEVLAEWIGRVVAVESPVHLDEAILRVRSAAGVRRSGSRIRAQMVWAVRRGVERARFRKDGEGFLWRPGHDTAEIRRRDGAVPGSLRKPEMIAAEEIGAALLHVVRASYGIDEAEAVTDAARPFGYKQAGPRIARRFREVLDQLLQSGEVERDGKLLRAPDGGEGS